MKESTSFDAEGPTSTGKTRPIHVTPEDEREFFLAVQHYKQQSGRLFPTCSELLEILQSLGYAKRIWQPVATWSPVADLSSLEADLQNSDEPSLLGWYSRVETPVVP